MADPNLKFQWVDLDPDGYGDHYFTFDGIKIYNLFRDYPYELSAQEKAIFDAENPFWADFFSDRTDDNE